MSRGVEGAWGNREVPPFGFGGEADANLKEEGGSRGNHGFTRAPLPEAREALA
jgi:hypothetical protein